jgi:hypothetical protein
MLAWRDDNDNDVKRAHECAHYRAHERDGVP